MEMCADVWSHFVLGWKCIEKSIRFLLSVVKLVVLRGVVYMYICGLTNVHVYRLIPLPSSSQSNGQRRLSIA